MKVLVVDDDMATVDVIKNTVCWERLGISEVLTAFNMGQAQKILKEYKVDIVISDIEMPQGTGLDLLCWFREQGMEGEFLLLTCHESFDYASNAVRLQAAEYLLKPFDIAVMEAALRKIILKLDAVHTLKENSRYGKWVKENKRQMQLTFFNMILNGHISSSREKMEEEIHNRNLTEDTLTDYCLIVSKITDIERDRDKMNADLLMFMMENIHSEILCGSPENENVIGYDYKDYYVFVTVCREIGMKQLENQSLELIAEYKKVFTSAITCCISEPCKITEFYEVFHRIMGIISANVVYYGTYFREIQCSEQKLQETFVLELSTMEEMLNQGKKMDFLSYLKQRLNDKVYEKRLNDQMLLQAKQEVLQVVYTYLAKRGIQASGLFVDELSNNLAQKASQSVINMMRWVNYLLEQTFAYENEVKKSYTVIDKIHQYIHEHYRENIGRNEIAAQFFLAPEYLSKMYRKQTGQSLKDYIGEYRIEQAKILLKKRDLRVSEVAEAVGFDNFTYFSTMFKKYTGVTPNQYRKE